jgi:hypothetical protein
MPRKTLKERNRPTDTKKNRIRPITNRLIGNENPDDLMQKILKVLTITESIPSVGKYYTFIYFPKTPNIRYDNHPLVAVTNIFNWGFRGINFHWREVRQYTWDEVSGELHLVYPNEIKDLQSIPYQKIQIS